MRVVLAWAGAALLVSAIAAIAWYETGFGGVSDGMPSALAIASASNLSLAVAGQPEASVAVAALPDVKSLAVRCQTAMSKNVCGIMTTSKSIANGDNTERLFIAGVGEVDAGVFTRLREAGNKMCGEVETECSANWAGVGCKIARAMYPV